MFTHSAIFLAGILTFFTPCVFPLLPIYLSALIGASPKMLPQHSRTELVWRASFFCLGFILVFTLLGLGASTVGLILSKHRLLLEFLGSVLIFIFGLKFLNLIQIPALDRIFRLKDSRRKTRFSWFNAFLMGLVFAAGWAPCTGPILGAVLSFTASASSDLLSGVIYLSLFGLGFSVPLMLAALFAGLLTRAFKKVLPYLPSIERIIGILLILVAVSLFWGASKNSLSKPTRSSGTNEFFTQDPVLLELYASNCAICRRMAPLVDEIEQTCQAQKVTVVKRDISLPENHYLIERYRVVGTPTFIFLDETGFEAVRLVGEQTRATLSQAVAALRGKPCTGLGLLPSPPPFESAGSCGDKGACSIR